MKNHAAYSEIGFLTKLILKPYDHTAVMPTSWELKSKIDLFDLLTEVSSINGLQVWPYNLNLWPLITVKIKILNQQKIFF